MFSKTLTLSGRFPGATGFPNQARGFVCVVIEGSSVKRRSGGADHLAEIVGRGAELDLLDLVVREADALELAAHGLRGLAVVDVDDGAGREVHVRVHEGGVLAAH